MGDNEKEAGKGGDESRMNVYSHNTMDLVRCAYRIDRVSSEDLVRAFLDACCQLPSLADEPRGVDFAVHCLTQALLHVEEARIKTQRDISHTTYGLLAAARDRLNADPTGDLAACVIEWMQ